jgi:hypothetical protein
MALDVRAFDDHLPVPAQGDRCLATLDHDLVLGAYAQTRAIYLGLEDYSRR